MDFLSCSELGMYIAKLRIKVVLCFVFGECRGSEF